MLRSRWFPMIWLSLVLGLGLAACGDTWRGLKQDTGENLEAVGGGMERAGEDVQDSAGDDVKDSAGDDVKESAP
jgi:predicted small secreted protein